MALDITRPIPAELWTTELVLEAYSGVLSYRAVIRALKRIDAISDAKRRPMLVNPEVLREHIPTIFHRCVQIVLERRMKQELERAQ
jgi:hypothetical protein